MAAVLLQRTGEPSLKPRRLVVIERRAIPARLDQLYGAHPDTIAELRATADQLQDVPRDWLESRQDMCHGLRRVAGRLRQIADRIEIIEPIGKKAGGPPRLARIAEKRGARRRVTDAQMSLAL